MITERMKRIGEQLREARATSKKIHIISSEGKWVVYKSGIEKVLFRYAEKLEAIEKAFELLHQGETDGVILHSKDGTVESYYPAH